MRLRLAQLTFSIFIALALQTHDCKAKVYVEIERVSAIVEKVHSDGSVTLSDGELYSPATPELVMSVLPGNPVTLLYYYSANKTRIYVQYAPGKFTLKLPKQNPPSRDRSPK